jgi:hypothetical protein
MSELKLPAASGGGSISIKGPASSGSDVDLLDTSGNIKLLDGQEIRFGTDNDLALSHDGSNSYFVNKTGSFHLYPKAGEAGLVSVPDGTTKIYYDGSKKLETTSTGINITGGIRLGGNNAVNEIDDYEEGTWTPTSAGGNWTFSNNTSKYTKVGNLVTVQMYVSNSGSGDTNNLVVGGLPYTVVTGGYTTNAWDMGKGSAKGVYARAESASTTLYFFYPSENLNTYRTYLKGEDIGAAYIIGSISYYTS